MTTNYETMSFDTLSVVPATVRCVDLVLLKEVTMAMAVSTAVRGQACNRVLVAPISTRRR